MARLPEPEKRAALARAAVEVLQREGLDISMARLADALGIKRPTLLYHFSTKAQIAELALFDLLTEQAAFVKGRVELQRHPIDRVHAHLCAVHEFHHGREARVVFLTQAIAASAGQRVTEILELAEQASEQNRQAAIELLRRGIAEGTVAPCDPAALFATIRALVDGLLLQRVMGGLELSPVHALIRERLLEPLKREPGKQGLAKRRRREPGKAAAKPRRAARGGRR